MAPGKKSGKAKPKFHPTSPGLQNGRLNDPTQPGSWSAPTGPQAAGQASDGEYLEGPRVGEVRRKVNVVNPEDNPPQHILVGPEEPMIKFDGNKDGLGDDDRRFAKLLCDTMFKAQPELKENTYLTEDVLFLEAMSLIESVRTLNMPYVDQTREIVYRMKKTMIAALNEAKDKEEDHADDESVSLTAIPNASQTTSPLEADSEETNSSEETTAGFIIDVWWSALREANKTAVKNLAHGPNTSSSAHNRQMTASDLMAPWTSPAAAGTNHRITHDSTRNVLTSRPAPAFCNPHAASKGLKLPNIWRDTTLDKKAPAPAYPRVPFTPITYDARDFPMLRPIQHFTDAQVQAIKGATAEAKKKEESKTEKGK